MSRGTEIEIGHTPRPARQRPGAFTILRQLADATFVDGSNHGGRSARALFCDRDGPLPGARSLKQHLAAHGNPQRVCVFVHGLACDESCWGERPAIVYGDALASELGYGALYVRYDSRRSHAQNGAALCALLGRLERVAGTRLREVVLVGHSLGGLVIRHACVHAAQRGRAWLRRIGMVVCLGTPHRGAPIARLLGRFARWYEGRLRRHDATRWLANLSEGLRDLQHGFCIPELPPAVRRIPHRYLAACVGPTPDHRLTRWLGDGVVSLDSATARDVPGDLRCATIGSLHHVHMLQEPRVYAQLKAWLAERRRRRVARRVRRRATRAIAQTVTSSA
ncbi:MAG TPA: alpha/beta fold hydrolase [Xanthomonadales bacterium]|nr:alpha/beta fold hydrolase [Xanthomonadales bacterium]